MSRFTPRFAAAIFDMDGTLIDSERLVIEAALSALAALGLPPRRDLLVEMVGAVNGPGHPPLAEAFGSAFDAEAFDVEWARAAEPLFATDIPRRPGARRLLSVLERLGIPRALATNSMTTTAHSKLGAAGIGGFFSVEAVIGRDLVARPKPDPAMFLHAAEVLGHAPEHCLVFEDSDPGVAAALAAGMCVVQIPDQRPPASRDATLIAASLMAGAREMGLIPAHAEETA